MKKNYSLFAKLGVAALAIVGGVFAWAETRTAADGSTQEFIWTKATSIKTNDEIIIGKTVGNTVYYLDPNATSAGKPLTFSGTLPSDEEGFLVVDGVTSVLGTPVESYQFQNKTTKTTLQENLAMGDRDLTPENCWNVIKNGVCNVSNVKRYIYFDTAESIFKTTTEPRDVEYFVKTWVTVPTFDESTLPSSADKFISTRDEKVEIKASTKAITYDDGSVQDGVQLAYGISTSSDNKTYSDVAWTTTAKNTLTASINLNQLGETDNDIYVKVQIKTLYASGETTVTDAQTKVYHIILLNNAVLEAAGSKIADDGTYNVKVTSNCDATLTYTAVVNEKNADGEWGQVGTVSETSITSGDDLDLVSVVAAAGRTIDPNGKQVVLTVTSSKTGHVDTQSVETTATYVLDPNDDNVWGNLQSYPTQNTAVTVGQTISIWYDLNNSNYTLAPGSHPQAVLIPEEGSDIQQETIDLRWNPQTGRLEFDVPDQFADTEAGGDAAVAFKVKVIEGDFTASNGASANTYTSPEGWLQFNGTYSDITWTINPTHRYLDADAKSLTVEFQVYPNGRSTYDTYMFDTKKITVTNSQNQVVDNGVTVSRKSGNTYTVTFTKEVVDEYYAQHMTGEFMVAFKSGALWATLPTGEVKNKNNVTGYISFYEAVKLGEPTLATTSPACTGDDDNEVGTINFTISAKGKRSGSDFTSTLALNTADGNKPVVTIKQGDVVKATAEITNNGDGNFSFVMPDEVKIDGTYTIEVNDKDFVSNQGKDVECYFKDGESEHSTKSFNYTLWSRVDFSISSIDAIDTDNKIYFTVTGTPKNHDDSDGTWHEYLSINNDVWYYSDDSGEHVKDTKKTPTIYTWNYKKVNVTVNGQAAVAKYYYQNVKNPTSMDLVIEDMSGITSTDGKYTVTINAGEFCGNLDQNREGEASATTAYHVDYYIENTVYQLPTNVLTCTYRVYAKTCKGDYIPAGQIAYAETTPEGTDRTVATAASFNDGYSDNFPTIAKDETVDYEKNGTATINGIANVPFTQFTATWANPLDQNNYQINFPVGTVYAANNANETKLYVNFQVMNQVLMSFQSDFDATLEDGELKDTTALTYTYETTVKENTQSIDLTIRGWDQVDQMYFDEYTLLDGTGVTIDGEAVKSFTQDATDPTKFTVETTEPLATGDYTITIPARAFKANYTYSHELTAIVHVSQKPTFNDGEVTVDMDATEVVFTGVVTNGEIETINGTCATVSPDYDASYMLYYNDDNGHIVIVPCTAVKENATDVKVTLESGYTFDPNVKNYNFVFYKAHSQGTNNNPAAITTTTGYENEDFVRWTITVNEWEFFDACKGATTTTAQEVTDILGGKPTRHFNTLTYHRTFGTTAIQAISLPFDTPVDTWTAAGLTVYYIDYISESVMNYVVKPAGSTMYANKPYIIKASATGTYDIDFTNVDLQAPTTNREIWCASTGTSYYFTNNYDKISKADLNTLGALILTSGKVQNPGGALVPWRWYMTSSDKGIEYVRITLDGVAAEGDETGIENISSDNAEGDIYDMSGRKLNTLKKGINIVNGAKVLVK